MAQKKTDVPVRVLKLGDSAAGAELTMLTVRGDPLSTLKHLRLPASAKVAIVSPDSTVVRKLKLRGKAQFGAVQTIYAGKAPIPLSAPAPVIDRAAFEPDCRAAALLEGVRIAREGLQAAGGAYDLDQARTLLKGISRQAIDKRVRKGSLLAVLGPGKRRRFPTLQFTGDGAVVPGLKAVRDALPSRNPWIMLNFLAHPDDRLDGRAPIDLLKAGDIDLVVEAALRVGQQGA